jgi:hypothetical protein
VGAVIGIVTEKVIELGQVFVQAGSEIYLTHGQFIQVCIEDSLAIDVINLLYH